MRRSGGRGAGADGHHHPRALRPASLPPHLPGRGRAGAAGRAAPRGRGGRRRRPTHAGGLPLALPGVAQPAPADGDGAAGQSALRGRVRGVPRPAGGAGGGRGVLAAVPAVAPGQELQGAARHHPLAAPVALGVRRRARPAHQPADRGAAAPPAAGAGAGDGGRRTDADVLLRLPALGQRQPRGALPPGRPGGPGPDHGGDGCRALRPGRSAAARAAASTPQQWGCGRPAADGYHE